jgi:hypothetical protein
MSVSVEHSIAASPACILPAHKAGRWLAAAAGFLSLTAPFAVPAADQSDVSAAYSEHEHHAPAADSPLVQKVRRAIAKYRDIRQALEREKGWAIATTCVSGPDTGAMGIHVVKGARIADGILNPQEPEALIYEPQPDGRMRLVGAEFIEDAADWAARNPDGPPPSLDGNLLNLVGFPNRFGLQAFYELHVWAVEENPKGSFADWNTHVTCEKQPEAL